MIVKIWDVPGQKELKALKGHTAAVTAALFSPDGKRVLSISQDRTLRVWDVATGTETETKEASSKKVNAYVTILMQRQPLATVSCSSYFLTVPQKPVTPDDLYGIAFSRDGQTLATSGYAGYLTIWDLAQGKPKSSRKLKTFGAYCLAFTSDGKTIVTGHDTGVLLFTRG